ncbi:hypothetical protein PENSPDRAFT_689487 [Peniophora sp. CONT]|nr:hypothetical protein PENSPDRAFT_689487 [Peniophora sp. CONT]
MAALNPVQASRPPIENIPFTGDFVVISLNPSLSVAHLDEEAKSQAAKLRTGRYVAMLTEMGLPIIARTTNDFLVNLVRDPQQQQDTSKDSNNRFKLPPLLRAQFSAPINPRISSPAPLDDKCRPLQPLVNFPFAGCEFDLAASDVFVRVTSEYRDRSRVLSLPSSEVRRLAYLQQDVLEDLEHLQIDLPDFNPQPDPDILSQHFPLLSSIEGLNEASSILRAEEDQSHKIVFDDMIASFAAALEESSTPNIPVVDVFYDLAEVKSIEDPSNFLRERWELYEIVRHATERMLRACAEKLVDD